MSEQDLTPRLAKRDGSTMTPGEAPMSRADFLEAVKLIVGGMQGAGAEATDAKDSAVVKALGDLRDDLKKGEYNLTNFPNISAFNPRGENATVGGRPRDPLKGEIAWVGTPVVWHEQTYEELQLLNRIEPGIYHNGEWVVQNMQPGVKGSRVLRVSFPCLTADERSELPNGYWDFNAKNEDGTTILGEDVADPNKRGRLVTGMEIMLREMVEEAASRVPVSA